MAASVSVVDNRYFEFAGQKNEKSREKISVLVATIDSRLRSVLSQLFESFGVDVLWATALEEVRVVLDQGKVAACFCGSWLVDGTYRNIVHTLRRRSSDIPVVMVCEPECSPEFQNYLAAVNIRAIDFFSHPYERSDFARIMKSISGSAEGESDCEPTAVCNEDEAVPALRPVS